VTVGVGLTGEPAWALPIWARLKTSALLPTDLGAYTHRHLVYVAVTVIVKAVTDLLSHRGRCADREAPLNAKYTPEVTLIVTLARGVFINNAIHIIIGAVTYLFAVGVVGCAHLTHLTARQTIGGARLSRGGLAGHRYDLIDGAIAVVVLPIT
jgi:hypothetical protein